MDPYRILLIVWGVAAVAFFIGEMLTEGFVLAWFGIGAGVAAVLALLRLPLWLQIVVFMVISGTLFALSRLFFKKITKKAPSGVGSERLMGRKGVVIERIDPLAASGRVRVYKEEWRAESIDAKPIEAGTEVEVLRIDGVHLVVKPKEE